VVTPGEGDARAGEVTRLLLRWNRGDSEALDQLVPLLYDELRRIAARHLRAERPDHTLQSTALVNEAYLKLVKQDRVRWANRAVPRRPRGDPLRGRLPAREDS